MNACHVPLLVYTWRQSYAKTFFFCPCKTISFTNKISESAYAKTFMPAKISLFLQYPDPILLILVARYLVRVFGTVSYMTCKDFQHFKLTMPTCWIVCLDCPPWLMPSNRGWRSINWPTCDPTSVYRSQEWRPSYISILNRDMCTWWNNLRLLEL